MGGFAYHVLNRAIGRGTLFQDEADYLAMERVIQRTHDWASNIGDDADGQSLVSQAKPAKNANPWPEESKVWPLPGCWRPARTGNVRFVLFPRDGSLPLV
jgi:hypothetical protein